ncbi:uncharacterized protein LOC105391057 [Plutella xylostella]|uniref:uncharacterized protein LOC105391057 n=1 Tax=Plutella xylostella TaxID=51655 RepID=UPI00203260D6|nr:uncharacterized protein LOC105391057 [Plutella xylostella]
MKTLALVCLVYLADAVASQKLLHNIDFVYPLDSQYGLGWPSTINVEEGHDILLKLSRPLPSQERCVITTAKGQRFDITTPLSNRFELWGETKCGVRVRNIQKSDEGRWRMTAVRGNFTYVGVSDVYVLDPNVTYSTQPIEVEDGAENAKINLTNIDDSSYCFVTQPFTEISSQLVSGNCSVTLERTSRAIQGTWNALLGLPGRVAEFRVQRQVAVKVPEKLDVGYIHDTQTNKLHVYCNLQHTQRNITFCRFQHNTEDTGYNVLDGLSDGQYSYFGRGFLLKECGITIERPTTEHYGTWKCSVGVQEMEKDKVVNGTPMQALVTVPTPQRFRRADEPQEPRSFFAQKEKPVTLSCSSHVSLSYCWFQAPDGQQYTPVPKLEASQEGSEQAYWYAGNGLTMGDCGITFANSTEEFAGTWTCHMGASQEVGLEHTNTLQVRLSEALAADVKKIEAAVGDVATVYCRTADGNKPLDYCRFVSPTGVGLHVDASVTADRAILGKYYFTPKRSLDYGDCSLNIVSFSDEDAGVWTCAAVVADDSVESRDSIEVIRSSYSSRKVSRAGIAGMSIGAALLVFIIAGYTWKRQGLPTPWRNTSSSRIVIMSELQQSGRTSASSSSTVSDSWTNGRSDNRNGQLARD